VSTTQVLATAIPALVILAVLVGFVSMRRRDEAGVGRLSRETRSRDVAVGLTGANGVEIVTGREVERAAALARIGTTIEPVRVPAAPEPWSPPDPEVLAVSRRQFLNRASIGLMILGTTGFGAASLAFLWPQLSGGFGSKINIGSLSGVIDSIDSSQPQRPRPISSAIPKIPCLLLRLCTRKTSSKVCVSATLPCGRSALI